MPQGTFPSHLLSSKVSRSVSWGAEEGFSDLLFGPQSLFFQRISPVLGESEGWGSLQLPLGHTDLNPEHLRKGQAHPHAPLALPISHLPPTPQVILVSVDVGQAVGWGVWTAKV